MKDFFKKHPELLYTLIAVIIIDAGIVWMFLGDSAATAVSNKKIETMATQAERIKDSKLKITEKNAQLAKEEETKIQAAFDSEISGKLKKYKYIKHPKENFNNDAPTAKSNFIDLIDGLTDALQDKDATGEQKLSFGEYARSKIPDMEIKEISALFEVLNGFSRLVEKCVDVGVISIDQVSRPYELSFIEDAKLGTKTYSYVIKLKASGDSIKKLLNQISSDGVYFYEVNSIKLTAVSQVSADMTPNIKRIVQVPKKENSVSPLDDIKRGLDDDEGDDDLENVIVIAEESTAPFTSAVNEVELKIDWVQFYKGAKK